MARSAICRRSRTIWCSRRFMRRSPFASLAMLVADRNAPWLQAGRRSRRSPTRRIPAVVPKHDRDPAALRLDAPTRPTAIRPPERDPSAETGVDPPTGGAEVLSGTYHHDGSQVSTGLVSQIGDSSRDLHERVLDDLLGFCGAPDERECSRTIPMYSARYKTSSAEEGPCRTATLLILRIVAITPYSARDAQSVAADSRRGIRQSLGQLQLDEVCT